MGVFRCQWFSHAWISPCLIMRHFPVLCSLDTHLLWSMKFSAVIMYAEDRLWSFISFALKLYDYIEVIFRPFVYARKVCWAISLLQKQPAHCIYSGRHLHRGKLTDFSRAAMLGFDFHCVFSWASASDNLFEKVLKWSKNYLCMNFSKSEYLSVVFFFFFGVQSRLVLIGVYVKWVRYTI